MFSNEMKGGLVGCKGAHSDQSRRINSQVLCKERQHLNTGTAGKPAIETSAAWHDSAVQCCKWVTAVLSCSWKGGCSGAGAGCGTRCISGPRVLLEPLGVSAGVQGSSAVLQQSVIVKGAA